MRAIAKLILFGEHSVVYGKRAIAIPIKNMSISTKIQKEQCNQDKHIRYIKKLLGIADNEYVKIRSNIPSARGFGSSAALAISMARLVGADEKKIADLAEKEAHGNPSGIDSAVIRHEKSLIFCKGKKNIFFKTNLNAYLLIADSGIKGNTKEAVEKVRELNRMDIIEELSNITEEAIKSIKEKNIEKIGKLFTKAQENLVKLNLSNETIDNMVKEMNKYSLGTKITGSGLGGCVISLCKNRADAENLKKIMIGKGIKKLWIVKV